MTGANRGNHAGMTDPTQTGPPVVVGVDGSAPSLEAVDVGVAEAAMRRVPLELVHGFRPPITPPLDGAAQSTLPFLREQAEQLLREAAARVRDRDAPATPAVITRLHDGHPVNVLAAASRHAGLVVIGHRGRGGFAGLVTGSVPVQLASHASGPVMVVRDDGAWRREGPVVVGVDGSDAAREAAEFAIDAASLYGAPLVVLQAWYPGAAWPPAHAAAGYPPPPAIDLAAAALGDLPDKYPQVRVIPEVRQHVSPAETLVAASEKARLVVVGSRGMGGLRGRLLGSVSQALIHHAHAPVTVIGAARD